MIGKELAASAPNHSKRGNIIFNGGKKGEYFVQNEFEIVSGAAKILTEIKRKRGHVIRFLLHVLWAERTLVYKQNKA